MATCPRNAASSGFSLIEILIATAILLVIVVMVSMVFQQQSAAFQSGTDRVKGQSALRDAMGMIVRDLSLAVNSDDYKDANGNSLGLPENSFSSDKLEFLATTGEVGYDAEGNADNNAVALQRITYNGGKNVVVQRTAQGYKLNNQGKWEKAGSESKAALNNDKTKIYINYSFSEKGSTFPTNVTINASYEGSSSAASVIGVSAGPDKKIIEEEDNIYVGGKDKK